MKFFNFSPHRWLSAGAAAVLLAASAAVPAFAGPTTISLSGSVDSVTPLGSTPMFNVGDSLSGMIHVNVGADGQFTLGDVDSFSLSLGSDDFGMADADSSASSLFGSLSADGSTLTDFGGALSFYTTDSDASNDVLFGFNGLGQPFSATGTTAIATGAFTASISGGGAVGVPEAPAWLWLALALPAIGVALRRRKVITRI